MGKVIVTGGSGLVGNAIQKVINKHHHYTFIFLNSSDCDLTCINDTRVLFEKHKPEYVIHLAANVGGLYKNMNNKVDMLESNLMINLNVLKCCHEFKVKRCISCLSTCIFPDNISYPIDESMLHDGPPHHSNDSYAYSKRMLDVQSKAYRYNYGSDFRCIIPTNIYGTHDNYNLQNAHVIPALIHKCYLSKKNNEPFKVCGTGKPLRQFIFADDLASLIIWTLETDEPFQNIILSVPENDEISIADVARKIARCFDYEHMIEFDNTYSDGQYKKTVNNSTLTRYINFEFTSIDKGLQESVNWFVKNYDNNIRL